MSQVASSGSSSAGAGSPINFDNAYTVFSTYVSDFFSFMADGTPATSIVASLGDAFQASPAVRLPVASCMKPLGAERESTTMMRYAKERKESVIRKMLATPDLSIPELARETGISCWTLYDWRKTIRPKEAADMPGGRPPVKRQAAQKLTVVVETAGLNEAELGEYCRRHGLYPEEVKAWRTDACQALEGGSISTKAHREALMAEQRQRKVLERELARKDKALAETAALLALRKKAAAIWGDEEDA